MKTSVLKCLKCVLFIFLFFYSSASFSQLTLTKVNGWNAYVHLPDDYNTTGTQTYPAIIFFPGTGEVGTDPSKLLINGPGYFLNSGWNGNVVLNGVTIKPIYILLQPPTVWPPTSIVAPEIDQVRTMYRIDQSRVSLTGLSMGGQVSEEYVESYPSKIASVVAIQAVKPDDNPAYPTPFTTFAQDCGHWLGYEQVNDGRDMITINNTMNAAVSGSAQYFQTNVGGGGHCCWNTWYDPTHTDSYSLNGVTGNWSIYQFMMTWSGCTTGLPKIAPTVAAGSAQTITLPVSAVTLTGTATGNNGATISSVAWTKVSGGAATITTATNLSTTVTGLVAGAYVFKLTATDKNGLTNSASVNITVNAAVVKTAPTVNAGPSQTVVLGSTPSSPPPPTTTPTSAYFNFSSASSAVSGWTNIHGSPGTAVVSASSNGITLSSVATGNWAPYNGMTSYDGNGVNAAGFFNNAAVSVNNWFQYGDPAANYNVSKPQLQATGLVPGATYTVKLSGSDNLGFQTNPVRFTIQGSAAYTPVDVNMNGTANNGATFSSVSPDATGKINIYVNTVPGVSSAAEIDGLQIIPNASSSQTAQVAQVSQTSIPTTTTVTLNGTATGNNGATIVSTTWSETSGTAAAITSPSALSTAVTGLAAGVYVFQLKATDNNGMSNSSTVTITVSSSTTSTAKSIQVNIYGGVNPYNNTAWNNWNVTSATAGPATSPAFTFTDGTTSPVTATLSVDQGVADNGTSYGGTITDPQVLRYASYNSYRRTLTLNNIPAGSLASLEIYGSRANTGNTSIYTINGVSQSLVTDYNLTQSVIFSNVTVTSGQVQVTIDKVSSFNYINGFRLSYTPSGTSVTGGITESMSTAEATPELLTAMTDKLEVFPNPFETAINLRWVNEYTGNASVVIYSLDGRLISSKQIVKSQPEYDDQINIAARSSGMYLLKIILPNGKSYTEKVVKK